ncbi:hypothetical protein [Candidatus Nitrotoga sp. AM1P]|nr:hypothetical protein [Candidatus Nitrotoga sp. AM1P]
MHHIVIAALKDKWNKATKKSYRNLDIRKIARPGCLPDGWFKGQ